MPDIYQNRNGLAVPVQKAGGLSPEAAALIESVSDTAAAAETTADAAKTTAAAAKANADKVPGIVTRLAAVEERFESNGRVKAANLPLSSAVNSTSETLAATAKAVKTAYDKAVAAQNAAVQAVVPAGGIILWSGAANAVPAGWHLCDGSSGTPDLRDRFIVGAGSTYAVGDKGGNSTANAALSGSTGATTLNAGQMPNHLHYVGTTGSDGSGGKWANVIAGGTSEWNIGTLNTGGAGGNGSHAHPLTGSVSVSTLPPYYALALIMKL